MNTNNNNSNNNNNANNANNTNNAAAPSISKNRSIPAPAGVWGKKPAFAPAPEVKVEVAPAPAPAPEPEVKVMPEVKTKTMSKKVQQIAAKSKFGALLDDESEDDAQEAEDEPASPKLQTTVFAQQELLDPENAEGFTSVAKVDQKPKAPKARVEICRDGPSCPNKANGSCQRIHFSKNFCRNGVACTRCKTKTCIYRPNSKVCTVVALPKPN